MTGSLVTLVATLGLVLTLAGCASNRSQNTLASTERMAELQFELGVGYMREGENELALRRLRRSLELKPGYPEAQNALGMLYHRLGETEAAEINLRQAIQAKPDFSAARTNYGTVLCQLGRVAEAEEQFLLAAKDILYENSAVAYTNAGLCLYAAGDVEKAERYLRQALVAAPSFPPALLKMAEISYESERYLPARAYLQRYAEVQPPTAQSLWLAVQVERVLGDKNAASSYGMLLQANFPQSEETRRFLESEPP